MIKTDRDYPKCNPEFALMDPTYTYTVPTKQMVAGSFDILSHVMETYFSEPDEDNVSDDISEALMLSLIHIFCIFIFDRYKIFAFIKLQFPTKFISYPTKVTNMVIRL